MLSQESLRVGSRYALFILLDWQCLTSWGLPKSCLPAGTAGPCATNEAIMRVQ